MIRLCENTKSPQLDSQGTFDVLGVGTTQGPDVSVSAAVEVERATLGQSYVLSTEATESHL